MVRRRDLFLHNGPRSFLFRFLHWSRPLRQFDESQIAALMVKMKASVEPPPDKDLAAASHSLSRRRELKEAVLKPDDPVRAHRSFFFDAKNRGQIDSLGRAVIIDHGTRLDLKLPVQTVHKSAIKHVVCFVDHAYVLESKLLDQPVLIDPV